MNTSSPEILDATCGGRMMWVQKDDPRILAHDARRETVSMTDRGSLRTMEINPQITGDFRRLNFPDESFTLVMFDPPHLIKAGKNSWLRKKYGILHKDTYQQDIAAGLRESLRVLRPGGTLVFKWNTCQIPLSKITPHFPAKPVFISRQQKTHFIIFHKPTDPKNTPVEKNA